MKRRDDQTQQMDREVPREPSAALFLAQAALAWERLWPALWPAVGLAGLFVALAWMGLPALLNPWVHLVLVLAVLGGFGWLLWRGLKDFRFPGVAEARRRIERDSAFRHRPLATITDNLAGDGRDPYAAALWQAAQERARRQVDRLTLKSPHPNLAARDPWALRAGVGLLLVVGATMSWGDLTGRLAAGLVPGLGIGGIGKPTLVEVWVTPPDYTGLPPIFLTRETAPKPTAAAAAAEPGPETPPEPDFVPVPEGSTVLARVTGGYGTPALTANGSASPFEAVAGGGWQADAEIETGETITITQGGREVDSWRIVVVPDQAPGIAFRQKPSETNRLALRLDYTAADDYGITGVTATVRLGVELPETVDQSPLSLPLPLPGRAPREASGTGYHDLTPHPWAGLPVLIRLEAVDARGQAGMSPDEPFVLPERRFTHPVARALIDQRKNLTLGGDRAREPVAQAISEISIRPGAYGEDLSIFLALRSSANRLMADREPGAITSVQQTLWDTALALEDGGLSLAEQALRDAQQNLMEALDNNASDAEIDQLMAELEQAMQDFMDALEEQMRQAMQDGQQMPEMQPPQDMQMMTREDLEQMMQQLRDMAETGSRDAAREMLSQLQQMMESLRTGQPPSPQQAQQNREMMEMMEQLQDLTQQQQQLMDETFRQSQEGQQGGEQQPGQQQGQQGQEGQMGQQGPQGPARQGRQPGGNPGQNQGQGPGSASDMAARQEALRQQLGEIMRRLGEAQGDIPRPLGRAERSMNDAGQALQQGAPGQAVPNQSQALDQLQQGLQSMAEQMAQQMMNQGMQAGARPQQGRMPGRDPLGRPLNGTGPFNSENVEIPEEADIQRAREILDELRRRAGEPDRPKLERDYIDRLLDRF